MCLYLMNLVEWLSVADRPGYSSELNVFIEVQLFLLDKHWTWFLQFSGAGLVSCWISLGWLLIRMCEVRSNDVSFWPVAGFLTIMVELFLNFGTYSVLLVVFGSLCLKCWFLSLMFICFCSSITLLSYIAAYCIV